MEILICGQVFIKNEKLFLWIAVIALAVQFHVTAVCAFPLYFTNRIENTEF